MAASSQHAYCTLLMTDSYLPGAMVLAHSLRDNGTQKQLAALVTLDSISASTIETLKTVYDHVIPVDAVVNRTPANLYLMDRSDLAASFTKIALWRLTQFSRVVYVDADVVSIRAPDELFNLESKFAAAPDVGWPDCFNSGVMALTPNMQDYYGLQALARNSVSFDGADQGLLNTHFSSKKWERISFTYNCTPSSNYQYAPAYRQFGSQISMIHFIGREKPWLAGRNAKGSSGAYGELLARWWAVYDAHYRIPTTAYSSRQALPNSRTVQQHVAGEAYDTDFGLSPPHTGSSIPSPPVTMPEPIFETADPVEQFDQGKVTPAPTAEQRRFSAPHTEWNPTREPPPAQSRPEASNFPTHQYTMSEDTGLFRPPTSYPEPPKDMYYEVPKERAPPATRPKPIFPWEHKQAPATRVFPEDKPISGVEPQFQAGLGLALLSTDNGRPAETSDTQGTPIIHISEHVPFSAYIRSNVWDDMPEIQRYIDDFARGRRGGKLINARHAQPSSLNDLSPEGEGLQARRPSLRLTDFPTEIERPSLPVTPAPIRGPSFWGEERNDQGKLPAAQGVPQQQNWDPLRKLEELQKRQSEIFLSGPMTTTNIPHRDLPKGSMPSFITEEVAVEEPSTTKGFSSPNESSATKPEPKVNTINEGYSYKEGPIIKKEAFSTREELSQNSVHVSAGLFVEARQT